MTVGAERWGRRWHALQDRFGAEMRVLVSGHIGSQTEVDAVLDRLVGNGPGYSDFVRMRTARIPWIELRSRCDVIRETEGLDGEAALIEAAIPYLMD